MYFAFEEDLEWLDFANSNREPIIKKLLDDLQSSSSAGIFREWFSINGGAIFSYTRLAYYVGYELVADLVREYGEMEAVTLWKSVNYKDIILAQLHMMLLKSQQSY